jgi:phosphoribosylformylglycinamidine cyclo-ligase
MTNDEGLTYRSAGVAPGDDLLGGLLRWVDRTASLRPGAGRPLIPNGFFASVIQLTEDLALALCTDGVGSKVLIAEMLENYDTIGIDCVAMNVNDLLCVGAEPVALVDYIGAEQAEPSVLAAIGKGLHEGARQAGVSIPGGELAQLPEIIRGVRPGAGIDLVGTAVGLVRPDRILTGDRIRPGDAVIGLRSSGIHSNGLTLARRALFDRGGLAPRDHVAELGCAVGDELLKPTAIYVRGVLSLLSARVDVRGCAHITSNSFLNLTRWSAAAGYLLDNLPEPPPIFALIQRLGQVPPSEMYYAFNMGIGFCIVVPDGEVERAAGLLREEGYPCQRIGSVVPGPEKCVNLPAQHLAGLDGRFQPA